MTYIIYHIIPNSTMVITLLSERTGPSPQPTSDAPMTPLFDDSGTLLFCPYSYTFQTCTWCHFIGAKGFDECLIVQVLTSQCLHRTSRRTGQMKQLEVYCIGTFPSSIRGKHMAKFGKIGCVVIHYDRLEESCLPIQPRGSITILGFS